MNPIPNEPFKPGVSSGFVFRKHKNRVRRTSSNSYVAAEVAAAATSVTVYHPLRTIATQLSAGVTLKLGLVDLYRGFWTSACGAHQLFLMAAFERRLSKQFLNTEKEPTVFQRIFMGAAAGFLTTPTVTPFDMVGVQRQLKRSFEIEMKDVSKLYRGFFPVALRQTGLGAGMFILPTLLMERCHEIFPSYSAIHQDVVKVSMGFAGGCVSATATQVFEMARLLMQEDVQRKKYPTTLSALKEVPKQLFSVRGVKMYAVRLSVVASATIVMNYSREFYSKYFGGKD